MRKEDIAGVVLAGGLSRRMGGGDKGLRTLGQRSVLDHVVSRLRPQVGPLALNANGDPARFAHLGLPVLPDTMEGFAGPLAGVLAGLEWAASLPGCTGLVTAAGDTPFLPADLVSRLARAAGGQERIAVAASGGRRHPVFALWPLAVRYDLADALAGGERRVSAFIERHPHVTAAFAMATTAGGRPRDPFFNVNTPEDLEEAEAMLPDMEQEATGESGATVQR